MGTKAPDAFRLTFGPRRYCAFPRKGIGWRAFK